CELFVMDDGWFSSRITDKSGLGDWNVNKFKFPKGLNSLIKSINALGMDFGIWFEPEMVNPASVLYKKHPEWTYHYSSRKPNLLRNQLVLNLTKPEVQKYILTCLDDMLSSCNIKYIKWDMNRPFSEIGADNLENPKELWYRHTQAVYDIVDSLKQKHPDVQFEACASGGGRTDLGALSHFDMVWPSDNTDPLDRLDIQQGYSLLYPIKCMRSWVTDTNKNSRQVSLDYRFNVSMQGVLSIGADLTKYSRQELELCKKYIKLYKEIRHTIQFGKLYRIMDFSKDKIYFKGYVSSDKSQAVFFADTNANSFFGDRFVNLKFKGLDEEARYSVKTDRRKFIKSGAYLMSVGIDTDYTKPLDSEIFILNKIK
ncbi:MAG: alpha-galactosidase, partial [Clostridiales bacterium]|nr:alpha-galactosidase [Clostridiales bacterium]